MEGHQNIDLHLIENKKNTFLLLYYSSITSKKNKSMIFWIGLNVIMKKGVPVLPLIINAGCLTN